MLTVGPPGPQCWLMVALLVLRIWLADLLARCQGFRSVLGSIGELLCMCCRVLAFVLLGGETCLFGDHYTVVILPRRIRLLRIGFEVYTATFCIPLRECMRIYAERVRLQRFALLLINDTERFPTLAKCYRQPFCKASGL